MSVRLFKYDKRVAELRLFQLPAMSLQLNEVHFENLGRNSADNADSIRVIMKGSYSDANPVDIVHLSDDNLSDIFTPQDIPKGQHINEESKYPPRTMMMEKNEILYSFSTVVNDSSYYASMGQPHLYKEQFFIPGRTYTANLSYRYSPQSYWFNHRASYTLMSTASIIYTSNNLRIRM